MQCIVCRKSGGFFSSNMFEEVDGKVYCNSCYEDLTREKCESCGAITSSRERPPRIEIKGKYYCNSCGKKVKADLSNKEAGFIEKDSELYKEIQKIKITTTNMFDGYKIIDYLGVESGVTIMGSGVILDWSEEIYDSFGVRSYEYEKNLMKGKELAFNTLKYKAHKLGGDAIIGIDIDFTEYSSNRVGVIINGTVVKLEKIEDK